MKKIALALGLAGMLLLSGCGGGTSGGGTTAPVQPAPPAEPEGPPMSDNGNYILVPGYEYTIEQGETLEMNVLAKGNVMFSGDKCSYTAFDSNYNKYMTHGDFNSINNGNSYEFDQGQYYINVYNCNYGTSGTMSVQSNVL